MQAIRLARKPDIEEKAEEREKPYICGRKLKRREGRSAEEKMLRVAESLL